MAEISGYSVSRFSELYKKCYNVSPLPKDIQSDNVLNSEEIDEETRSSCYEDDSEDEIVIGIDQSHADRLISDSLAKELLKKEDNVVYTSGSKKGIINVDTISSNFKSGARVDVNSLKELNLIPYDTAYIKVLARGMIDKPLRVYANDFSISAVKMIALTGGEAHKVTTVKYTKFEKE